MVDKNKLLWPLNARLSGLAADHTQIPSETPLRPRIEAKNKQELSKTSRKKKVEIAN